MTLRRRSLLFLLVASLALTLATLATGIVAASQPARTDRQHLASPRAGSDTPLAGGADATCSSCAAANAFDCGNVTEIPSEECQALVALYNATDGPNWDDNSDWLQTNTPCGWHGVTCQNGHVTELRLSRNQLAGSLPAEIRNFSHLEWLDLSWNQVGGTIPPQLCQLTNLTHLDLTANEFSGSIPSELANLTNLRSLKLRGSQFTGAIPPELGSLINLTFLDLDDNLLTGNIPPELGDLTNLTTLDLSDNQLDGSIPPELGDLTQLSYFSVWANRLGGSIPPELGNLTNLTGLELSGNRLVGSIPPELGDLVSLTTLDVSCNALEGDIPPAIANLSNLLPTPGSVADFGYNKLSASDPTLIAFLAEKDPDWAETQTVPPANVQVASVSAGRVDLTWTPISYTQGNGCYEVWYSQVSGGPYEAHFDTTDKTASGAVVKGLKGVATYYLVVRTYSQAYSLQRNDLWSDYSPEVTVTTPEFCHWLPMVMSR
jgi:hypothetical protein